VHSVSQTMTKLREANKGAFVPFIMAGDPDLDTTEKALLALDEAGADVIELGVPYSDPLADGPTIQASHTRGLESKTTLEKVIALVAKVSPRLQAPIILFQYSNPSLRKGPEEYCRQAKEAGAAGILVPDLCLEETEVMQAATKAAGLELTQLVTPTTPQDRMKRIAAVSEGFVYLVSLTGVTGGRATNQSRVQGLIKLLREVTADAKSVAVGFGVSGPEQAVELRKWGAEGVIVGSALVKALGEATTPEEGLQQFTALAKSIRAAI